ncbi:MAG TPA: YceI family protein [Candidatus Krumholzibacteria bacterium]|nr:YceI family protein [Candidatus Krumholzibacteria bacterium]
MNRKHVITALLALTVATGSLATARAADYAIDPAHSSVGFQIKHLAIAKVNGTFSGFEGTIAFEEGKPGAWSVKATIPTASVDTGNKDRDDHLRSPDFFDAAAYPTMTFTSTAVTMTSATEGQLQGELTLHGVTRPVTLDLEFNGAVTDPWGNEKIGFSASGEIDRKDWGLTFNKTLDNGGLMIGDTVKISLEIEAARVK